MNTLRITRIYRLKRLQIPPKRQFDSTPEKMFTGIPVEYQWNTTGHSTGIFRWNSNVTPLEFQRYSTGIPAIFHWNSSDIPLEFQRNIPVKFKRYSTGIPVIFQSSGISLKFQWNFNDLPVEFQWYSTEISMIFHWNFNDISLEFQWYSTGISMIFHWIERQTSSIYIHCINCLLIL